MQKNLSPLHHIILVMLLSAPGCLSAQEILPMPLESNDPAKPLVILDDRTWSGADVEVKPGQMHSFPLREFKHEEGKGPVTLVMDYAATRPNDDAGEALFDVGVECFQEQNTDGCPIPIAQSVMGVRSNLMGESVAIIEGSPQPVWVGRVSHTYFLPPGSTVSVYVSANQSEHLDPKALRLRLIYGDYNTAGLPGQKTRTGVFTKISIAVLLMLIGFIWWMRRQ